MNQQNYFSNLPKCYLIAEIGVNHNGNMNLAYQMIDAAKESGADAVKFQTFTADALVSQTTPKVRYQESNTAPEETHYDMLHKLELTRENHILLKAYCEHLDLEFLSTPYDVESARFLHEELNVTLFKTASADIVDLPLHRYIASTGKPAIVSTGMANLGEIEEVIEIYRQAQNSNLVLLHCVSNYPCEDESLNLKVMKTLQYAFDVPVGYSDHSVGLEAATLSIGLGATVIEKHFTLDKNLSGPDHTASSTPEEFSQLVTAVRRAEKMLGSPVKKCQEEERQMAQISRKSIVLNIPLSAGELIEAKHLTLKRPGTGLAAKEIDRLIGKITTRSLEKGYQITFSDLK
ncbi:N-acetylneuraminate synthase [Vreelandella boliviensis]|uniref:N-acetylneuraminate synthase n=1 Tax=Vreelandella boliviensis TaxID=223527 RepID=UPI001B8D6B9C|nr:N-acetylneuraminate synthase [Halomonas boliviensis]MBS3667308.1 N-acetylneuraminate synthase [Halomonas boliviensis]